MIGIGWGTPRFDALCEARARAVYEQPAETEEALLMWQAAGVQRVLVHDGGGPHSDAACNEANGNIWGLLYALEHVKQHDNCVRYFTPSDGTDMLALANAANRAAQEECGGGQLAL